MTLKEIDQIFAPKDNRIQGFVKQWGWYDIFLSVMIQFAGYFYYINKEIFGLSINGLFNYIIFILGLYSFAWLFTMKDSFLAYKTKYLLSFYTDFHHYLGTIRKHSKIHKTNTDEVSRTDFLKANDWLEKCDYLELKIIKEYKESGRLDAENRPNSCEVLDIQQVFEKVHKTMALSKMFQMLFPYLTFVVFCLNSICSWKFEIVLVSSIILFISLIPLREALNLSLKIVMGDSYEYFTCNPHSDWYLKFFKSGLKSQSLYKYPVSSVPYSELQEKFEVEWYDLFSKLVHFIYVNSIESK